MGQPVRKIIQETHADLMKEEPFYTLLVDGNSLLFMCFKDNKTAQDGAHYGAVYQFLLQLRMMMAKKDFDYVYVFFDSTYSGWMRWNLYNEYKQNRDKHYDEYGLSDYMKGLKEDERRMLAYFKRKKAKKDAAAGKEQKPKSKTDVYKEFIDANFDRERDIICQICSELLIRWNIDEVTEGDDQIAYYCTHKKENEKIYIMSGDMDLSQLLADDIAIYNLHLKKFITNKNFKDYFGYYYENTLVKKVFTGDSSDNIGNIKGLSEDGFFSLMPEALTRKVTIDEVKQRAQEKIDERLAEKKKPLVVHQNIINGVSNKEYNGDFYEINTQIIDLKHPIMSQTALDTMDSMMYAPMDATNCSIQNVYRLIKYLEVDELKGDTAFTTFFSVFNKLSNKERKRSEEGVKE